MSFACGRCSRSRWSGSARPSTPSTSASGPPRRPRYYFTHIVSNNIISFLWRITLYDTIRTHHNTLFWRESADSTSASGTPMRSSNHIILHYIAHTSYHLAYILYCIALHCIYYPASARDPKRPRIENLNRPATGPGGGQEGDALPQPLQLL